MSAGFTPDEVYCSFCDRAIGQSHTENCPAREEEGEYVELAPSRFDVAAQAIQDGLDRRDTTIAALYGALAEYMACVALATNPAMQQADVITLVEFQDRMVRARDNAEAVLKQARGDLVDPLEQVKL